MADRPSFVVEDQSEVIGFLEKCLAPAKRIDTHGAVVFLSGDRGYKLKRAVKFPYMDFSTVERRAEMCAAEVEFNQRMAPEIYLGVVPIRRTPALVLGELNEKASDAADWLVVMRLRRTYVRPDGGRGGTRAGVGAGWRSRQPAAIAQFLQPDATAFVPRCSLPPIMAPLDRESKKAPEACGPGSSWWRRVEPGHPALPRRSQHYCGPFDASVLRADRQHRCDVRRLHPDGSAPPCRNLRCGQPRGPPQVSWGVATGAALLPCSGAAACRAT